VTLERTFTSQVVCARARTSPRRKPWVSRQKSIEAPQGAKEGHGRRAFAVFFSPLRGLTEFRHKTHGLRRGLRCCRAGALLLWPLERQDGPRPRSGRYNSRGSRVGERSEQARDPRIPEPRCVDRGAVALGS